MRRSSQGKQENSVDHQDNKTGKKKNMQDSGGDITRVAPLAQPELENSSEPRERPVKTRIALSAQKRRQTPRDDVRKAHRTQQVDDQEQNSSRDHPVSRVGDVLHGCSRLPVPEIPRLPSRHGAPGRL